MSFPASLTTRIFQGGFVTYPDGAAARGSVRIVLTTAMQGPAEHLFVVPFDVTIPLDSNGNFSVILPATDDPQWTESSYKVTVVTEGDPRHRRPLLMMGNMPAPAVMKTILQVPYNQSGPIYATDVFNLPAPVKGESYVLLASKGTPGGVASLGSDGKVPANQLPDSIAVTVSWLDLVDKPTTFPPLAHSHAMSQVTGLETALGDKASVSALAGMVSDSDLTTGLAGKADTNHTHATSQVSGLDASLASKATASDLTTGLASKANTAHTHAQTDITGLGTALSAKADTSAVTTALTAKADTSALTSGLAGKADLVGGVLPTSQLPSIAVIDFLGSVSTQAAMLALTGQKGDWCIRTDLGQSWVITGATPTSLGSWTSMPIGTAPVQTVNGQTGTVVLAKADVGLGNVDNTTDAGKPVSTAQQTALNLKAPLASPTFTGTVSGVTAAMVGLGNVSNTADSAKPVSTGQQTALDLKADLANPTFTGTVVAPTQTLGNNSNKVATTAFVAATVALKAPLDSPALTGTPIAPTATAGANTTQIATTEFVATAVAGVSGGTPGPATVIQVRVWNATVSAIAKGAALYASGVDATSGYSTVGLATATGILGAAFLGIAAETIAASASGLVTTSGVVDDVNTSTITAGSSVYLSTTAGGISASPATSANFRVMIGVVLASNATTGKILVRPSGQPNLGYGTANQILGMNTGASGQEYKTFAGTVNQVTVTHGTNSVTLSIPSNAVLPGLPTAASTAAGGDNTTRLATTTFVNTAVAALTQPADHAFCAWSFCPDNVQAGTILPTAGLSYVVRVRVMSTTVSAINLHLTAGGSALANAFATLHTDAGVYIANSVTADQSTNWASGGFKAMSVTTALTGLTYGAWYKIRFWVGSATTMPTLSRAVNSSSAITNAGLVAPNFRYSTADTGLTTFALAPTTLGTLTGGPTAWWVSLTA